MSRDDNPWTLGPPRVAFENPWIRVEDYEAIDPNGTPRSYGIVRFKKIAAGVLPIDSEGRVHLVGQWRVPLGLYSWEMPEGGVEPGEDIEESARRELEEESGLTAGPLTHILTMHLSNSVTDEVAHLYLALDLTLGEASPEPVEVLANRTAPFLEVLQDVVAGRITDSLTVAAVLRAHHMAVTGEIEPARAASMLGR
jgi:8-oxo-dGTP pyrophosphatase MutT (NUDIX family)